jgi:hypothetical protein
MFSMCLCVKFFKSQKLKQESNLIAKVFRLVNNHKKYRFKQLTTNN